MKEIFEWFERLGRAPILLVFAGGLVLFSCAVANFRPGGGQLGIFPQSVLGAVGLVLGASGYYEIIRMHRRLLDQMKDPDAEKPRAQASQDSMPNQFGESFFSGKYAADDKENYINNAVQHLSGKFFAITNKDWEGVGIFENIGSKYLGLYKYRNDGRYGILKGTLRPQDGKLLFDVSGADLGHLTLEPWGSWQKELAP